MYKFGRKKSLQASGGLLALGMIVASCGSTTAATTTTAAPKVSLPTQVKAGWVSVDDPYVAGVTLGTFSKYMGVPVSWTEFQGAATINTALASGSVDVSLLGSPGVALDIANGVGIKVIGIAEGVGSSEGLVARNSAGITSVKDLVGKTVATVFGSTSQFTLLSALKDANVQPSQVNIVNLDPPEIAAAWKIGKIDAAYIWAPALQALLSNGGHELINTAQLAKKNQGTYDLLVATTSFANKYPSLVTKFGQAEQALLDKFKNDPNSIAQTDATLLASTPADVLQYLGYYDFYNAAQQKVLLSPGGEIAKVLESEAQAAVQQGILSSAPTLAQYNAAMAGSLLP